MSKIVYLDQNHWIHLLRANLGKNIDKQTIEVLKKVRKTSENNTAIFPISNQHLIETYKKKNPKKRDEMLDFMVDISKGYAIVWYLAIQNFEIRQALLKKVGLPFQDPKEFVIGQGIPYIMGKKPSIRGKNGKKTNMPKMLQKKVIENIYSIETFKTCIKNHDYINAVRDHIKTEEDLVKRIEECIKKDKEFIKDKRLRKKYTFLRLSKDIIVPEMVKFSKELCYDHQEVMPWGVSEKWVYDFLEDMRSIYTSWVLTFRRDVQCNGKIKRSDIHDISALCMAIPYCDIVVTEKMWAYLVKKERLDQLYDTVILDSLNELNDYL